MFRRKKTQEQSLPNVDIMPQDEFQQAFSQIGNQNELAKVLQELFETKKIDMITDLTPDEIKLSTRIYMIADMKKIDSWKKGLALYLKLSLSKNRKSRSEIIDAFKGIQHRSFLSRLNPRNWGRGY